MSAYFPDALGLAGPEPARFGWSQRHTAAHDVICLAGEVDHDCATEVRRRLMGVVAAHPALTIVLDLSGLTFIDAGGIHAIVDFCDAATCAGRELRIDGLRGLPKRVFDILGLELTPARRATHDGARQA